MIYCSCCGLELWMLWPGASGVVASWSTYFRCCGLVRWVLWTGGLGVVARSSGCCGLEFGVLWPEVRGVVARSSGSCGKEFGVLWPGVRGIVARSLGCCGQELGVLWPGVRGVVAWSSWVREFWSQKQLVLDVERWGSPTLELWELEVGEEVGVSLRIQPLVLNRKICLSNYRYLYIINFFTPRR